MEMGWGIDKDEKGKKGGCTMTGPTMGAMSALKSSS